MKEYILKNGIISQFTDSQIETNLFRLEIGNKKYFYFKNFSEMNFEEIKNFFELRSQPFSLNETDFYLQKNIVENSFNEEKVLLRKNGAVLSYVNAFDCFFVNNFEQPKNKEEMASVERFKFFDQAKDFLDGKLTRQQFKKMYFSLKIKDFAKRLGVSVPTIINQRKRFKIKAKGKKFCGRRAKLVKE